MPKKKINKKNSKSVFTKVKSKANGKAKTGLKVETKKTKETYISPSLAGKSTSGKSGLSGAFTRLMATAGIDTERVDGKGKRKFQAKTFHSLRHTFNSMLANSGVSQETRMKLIGHASEQINDQYTHIQMETLRRDIENLPSFKL